MLKTLPQSQRPCSHYWFTQTFESRGLDILAYLSDMQDSTEGWAFKEQYFLVWSTEENVSFTFFLAQIICWVQLDFLSHSQAAETDFVKVREVKGQIIYTTLTMEENTTDSLPV